MKRNLLLALLTTFLTVGVYAQSTNNQDEVCKIDQHAARAYRRGEVIVKFNAQSCVKVTNRSAIEGSKGVDAVFAKMGVNNIEQLMPLSNEVQSRNLRSVNGGTVNANDMSQLYRVEFSNDTLHVHQVAEELDKLEEVEFAEPNYLVYTLAEADNTETDDAGIFANEPLFKDQWAINALNIKNVWTKKKITDKRPVIAILDTGVDISHPDLDGNIWTNEAEASGFEDEDDDNNGYADDIHGYDFVNNTAYIEDRNGHGTHCAGTAAGVGNNGKGITGVNPDALIMPVTVMQSDGTGDVATIIKGIDYAAANGADVISMSIGGYGYSMAEEQALLRAYETAILVAAAGNDYRCINTHSCQLNKKNANENGPMFPAAFSFVLGVEAADKQGNLATFSNYDDDGATFSTFGEDKLYNYELRAPGVSIVSTYPDGVYKSLSGTSMACPLIAGGISRLLQCKEYDNKQLLFSDLVQSRKKNNNTIVDFKQVYEMTDENRAPQLEWLSFVIDDANTGNNDKKADAGETIEIYPLLRANWGTAELIEIDVEVTENCTDVVVIEESKVAFGQTLYSYDKAFSQKPLRCKIAEDCVDGKEISLKCYVTCRGIEQPLEKTIVFKVDNGVEIGGMIEEDLTLYPNVHYVVTRPLSVPSNVTLTIKPGTVLRFKDGSGFSSSSSDRIICKGTPDSMIVFTADEEEAGYLNGITFSNDTLSYVLFENLHVQGSKYLLAFTVSPLFNGIVRNCTAEQHLIDLSQGYGSATRFENTNVINCQVLATSNQESHSQIGATSSMRLVPLLSSFRVYEGSQVTSDRLVHCNVLNNNLIIKDESNCSLLEPSNAQASNVFNNTITDPSKGEVSKNNAICFFETPYVYETNRPSYWGSANELTVREGIWDMEHTIQKLGFAKFNLSNMLTRPSAEAHGIVWKVVVNGYDAQDEFDLLPPLGVGKHKFEVYFNRPMNKEVEPFVAMGVNSPYTQKSITEEGSWNEDGTIYTAYLTIDGKTGIDGLNRIYVADAEDDEHFEIPVEDQRFNVEVSAAGSMATGLMAEPGLGKVSLTWETDEEDFEDLLGYNIYRHTATGVKGDTVIVNNTVIDSEENAFVDYNVVPGTTYYYAIKQLTTSLTSHALSNEVAATPLTATKGDANGSMSVDVADVVTEIAYLTNQNPQPFIFEAADVNADNTVNILDVVGTVYIIITPQTASMSANSSATYSIEDGILYVETPVALGGVQVQLSGKSGDEFTAMPALDDFERVGVWNTETDYLFMAYSMSGKTLLPGKHALLSINHADISAVVLSDVLGKNVVAIDGNLTGIGTVEATQMRLPYPSPFNSELTIPYVIGQDGSHAVSIVITDVMGKTIHQYDVQNEFGEYAYTWKPAGSLANGLYLISLYADGVLMQTTKVMYHK